MRARKQDAARGAPVAGRRMHSALFMLSSEHPLFAGTRLRHVSISGKLVCLSELVDAPAFQALARRHGGVFVAYGGATSGGHRWRWCADTHEYRPHMCTQYVWRGRSHSAGRSRARRKHPLARSHLAKDTFIRYFLRLVATWRSATEHRRVCLTMSMMTSVMGSSMRMASGRQVA